MALLGLALLLTAAATPVLATSVRRMSLEETAAAADRIVFGRVEAVRSYWEGTQLWTEVTLATGRTLKGDRSARTTFVQLGGRVDSPVPLEMSVPGAPLHRVGDEGYYFLEPRGARRVIVGLHRGHFPLRHDEGGPYLRHEGRRMAPADFEEAVRKALETRERGVRPDAAAPESRQ